MKKSLTLLLACTLTLCSFAQQKDATTQTNTNVTEEQKQAFLSVIGGFSAAYILTAQDNIDVQVTGFSIERVDAQTATQKLTMQKNIIGLLKEQSKKLETTNAVGPNSPDYSYMSDLNTTLNLMIKEIDMGLEYVKSKTSSNKTQFDTASSLATKNIKALLGME
jgi:hypothetical protein